MKRYVSKRKVRILYILFLMMVLLVFCAAVPSFYESPGGVLTGADPASADEAAQTDNAPATPSSASRATPSDASATPDEPAPDKHEIDVEAMYQNELSSGCEVYAAVTLLRYYGYDVDEFEFSEDYVTTHPNSYGDGGYCGPDLNSAFAGDPETGYGAYAPVLRSAINSYLDDEKSDDIAVIEKELTLGELCGRYIARDNPVMVWVTTDMELPYDYITWTVDYVDENATTEEGDEFSWPVNEHCMLLTGYDGDSFYFADSLEGGIVSYEREQCEKVFEELGFQAVVLSRDGNRTD